MPAAEPEGGGGGGRGKVCSASPNTFNIDTPTLARNASVNNKPPPHIKLYISMSGEPGWNPLPQDLEDGELSDRDATSSLPSSSADRPVPVPVQGPASQGASAQKQDKGKGVQRGESNHPS